MHEKVSILLLQRTIFWYVKSSQTKKAEFQAMSNHVGNIKLDFFGILKCLHLFTWVGSLKIFLNFV